MERETREMIKSAIRDIELCVLDGIFSPIPAIKELLSITNSIGVHSDSQIRAQVKHMYEGYMSFDKE